VVPHQLIEYVLGDSRSVSIRFEPTEAGIQVSETFQAEDVHAAELQKQGWQSILNRFAAYVEAKNA
jgi:hypothetical protein